MTTVRITIQAADADAVKRALEQLGKVLSVDPHEPADERRHDFPEKRHSVTVTAHLNDHHLHLSDRCS
jgi:hypothetical protein